MLYLHLKKYAYAKQFKLFSDRDGNVTMQQMTIITV